MDEVDKPLGLPEISRLFQYSDSLFGIRIQGNFDDIRLNDCFFRFISDEAYYECERKFLARF